MFCAACASDGSAFAFSFTKAVENGTHHGDLLLRSTNGKEKVVSAVHLPFYLNTLSQTKQFPVQINEYVHISEEVINH